MKITRHFQGFMIITTCFRKFLMNIPKLLHGYYEHTIYFTLFFIENLIAVFLKIVQFRHAFHKKSFKFLNQKSVLHGSDENYS